MTREEYARDYSGGYARNGSSVQVPPDIQRVEDHWPCSYCGVRPGIPCKHKRWTA